MVVGIGIDSVDIQRFSEWYHFSEKQLGKILSPSEIAYCLSNKTLSAQRFAVRFAAREAFFKAWNGAYPDAYLPFLTCCRSLTLTKNSHNAPILQIDWQLLKSSQPLFEPLISITHTSSVATAFVVLQKISK